MTKFIDFIENREEFLESNFISKLLTKKVKDEIEYYNNPYLELTKSPFQLRKDMNYTYLTDVVIYREHNKSQHMIVVDKLTKTILINADSVKWSIRNVSYTEALKIINDNLIKELDGYKIKTLSSLRDEFIDTVRYVEKSLTDKNNDLISNYGKKYLEEELKNSKYKNEILDEIKLDFIFNRTENIKPTTNYLSHHYSSKFHNVYYNHSNSNVLTDLMLEYLRDKDKLIEDLKEEYYMGLNHFDSESNKYNRRIYLYNYKNKLLNEKKDEIFNDSDLINKKSIIEALHKAGKTVIINDIKYDKVISKDYKGNIEIGSYKGNGPISIDDVNTIQFGGKTLYSKS